MQTSFCRKTSSKDDPRSGCPIADGISHSVHTDWAVQEEVANSCPSDRAISRGITVPHGQPGDATNLRPEQSQPGRRRSSKEVIMPEVMPGRLVIGSTTIDSRSARTGSAAGAALALSVALHWSRPGDPARPHETSR